MAAAAARAATARQLAAPAVPASKKSAATVTVACKIPGGLELQLCRQEGYSEDQKDGRVVARTRWVKHGQVYVVRGPAYPNGPVPRGMPRPPTLAGGYALTPGIPLDFWNEWVEQNKDSQFVVGGMIRAEERRADMVSVAREHRAERSGLEPMAQDGDPRAPKPLLAPVSKLEPDDDWAARDHSPEASAEDEGEDG